MYNIPEVSVMNLWAEFWGGRTLKHLTEQKFRLCQQSINQSINQNLCHINYNQVQHIHNNVERGK